MNLLNLIILIVGLLVSATFAKENITIEKFRIKFADERIVGGSETYPNEFPWYALLTTRTRQQFCGATILSEHFVLTATHCMVLNKNDFFVAAGVHNRLITIDGTEQYARVEEIFNHPDFVDLPMEHDVTVLRVNPPFKFNQYVGAIALPDTSTVPIDSVTAIGWGNTNYTIVNGSFAPAPYLKKINLTIQTTEECSKNYEDVFWQGGIPSKITDRMICAASDRDNESVCQGDSGGGLRISIKNGVSCQGPGLRYPGSRFTNIIWMTKIKDCFQCLCEDSNGREFVCGIASFLAGCGFQKYSSVYTKVDRYIDFIRSRIGLVPLPIGETTTAPVATTTSATEKLLPGNTFVIWCMLSSVTVRIFK